MPEQQMEQQSSVPTETTAPVQATDLPMPEMEVEDDEEPFSDEYESEVMRLLSLSVRALNDALSRVDDLGLLYLARDREVMGEGRISARRAYDDKIRSLGGVV